MKRKDPQDCPILIRVWTKKAVPYPEREGRWVVVFPTYPSSLAEGFYCLEQEEGFILSRRVLDHSVPIRDLAFLQTVLIELQSPKAAKGLPAPYETMRLYELLNGGIHRRRSEAYQALHSK